MLRERDVIEGVNNRLKNGCQIEHHRHRSPKNFLANLFGGLAVYQLIYCNFLHELIQNSR